MSMKNEMFDDMFIALIILGKSFIVQNQQNIAIMMQIVHCMQSIRNNLFAAVQFIKIMKTLFSNKHTSRYKNL